ncbi:MAG: hypothetical protein EOM24_27130, partial [Chloroflexia bacterium]|nr:hypothetical protein [Chloroflexia bacterium]
MIQGTNMAHLDPAVAYQHPAETVLVAFDSDAINGLATEEAHRRLAQHGPNMLQAETPTPAWRRFLAQFQNVLIGLLLIAAATSLALWAYEGATSVPYEALVIFAIVLFNGVLGYVQEARADRSVAALRAMTAAEASVLRDGQLQRVPTRDLVPGDIMQIEAGDTIPADGRLTSAIALQVAEASLTGESLPVAKDSDPLPQELSIGDRSNSVFSGTDVSKAAADMILTDDNFATIVVVVGEGRSIVANIQKFLRFLLSSNIGEVLTMFGGVMLADRLGLTASGDSAIIAPLLAIHVLWINLVTDGAPALALGLDPADPAVMQQQPRAQGSGIITRTMWFGIGLVGVIMAVGTLLVLDASLPGGLIVGSGTMAYGQTMALTTLVLFQLFNVFNARSDTHSAFYRLFHNKWLFGAIALSLALQVAVIYVPLLQRAFDTVPIK